MPPSNVAPSAVLRPKEVRILRERCCAAYPCPVYDSRWAVFGGAKINSGESRSISVKDRRRINPDDGAVDLADFVPAGSRAVAYDLTVTETVNAGFLAATPGDATTYAASTINGSQTNQNLANGTVVQLD